MKIVIFCGGYGTRLSSETIKKPKPMVEVGPYPILLHIMKLYYFYGYSKFILALGYKSNYIKNYFKKNFFTGINVKLVNTGLKTNTGGRLLKLKKYLKDDEHFFLTYGDGVSNVNLDKLLNFHLKNKKIATLTAVRPPVRFGELQLSNNIVNSFEEKPQAKKGWINGGFFVFSKKIFSYLNGNKMLEREPIKKLVIRKQLMAFKHNGFWQCMDNLRDKKYLDKLYRTRKPAWLNDKKFF